MNTSTNSAHRFKDYLQEQQISSQTIAGKEKAVLNFISWLDAQGIEVENVRHADILIYIKSCQKREVKQVSIQSYLRAIKDFFAFKISCGTMEYNPVSSVKVQGVQRRKLHHIFTPEELNKIYNDYRPEEIEKKGGRSQKEHLLIEKRNRVILGLYVYQGIQSAELYRLEIADVNIRAGEITVPEIKRSNSRTLQLEAHQVMDLYEYILKVRNEILAMSGQETESLFISPKGGNDQSNYVNTLTRQLKRINPKVKNAQQLRASVIVKWLKQYNLREVQYKAGHRYISSTEAFLVNEMEGLSEEINQFHPLS